MSTSTTSSLKGRNIPFDFPLDLKPDWIPNQAQFASMVNGASLTMPYLEPFLIRTIREAGKSISDPALKQDIAGFASQESFHFRAHRRFNDLLKANHYPEIEALEQQMQESYQRLSKQPLQARMAYTAGFEAMTMGLTKWLIGDRTRLFAGANPQATSFVLWHMVEETEHKRVAHDVYHALYPKGIRAYLSRAWGVFHGSFDVMRFSRRGYILMLKKDGLWWNIPSRLRLYKRICNFLWRVAPFLIRAALPGHDPRQEQDLKWVSDWLASYEKHPHELPLVDTQSPTMPVPFGQNSTEIMS